MKEFTIKIESVRVVVGNGSDRIYIKAGLPSAYPKWLPHEEASLDILCEHEYGAQYVKDVFGIEPEVVRYGSKV